MNSGIRGQSFEQFKILATKFRLTYVHVLKEVTSNSPIQLRTSRTDHVSATNHKICQFVAIRGSNTTILHYELTTILIKKNKNV